MCYSRCAFAVLVLEFVTPVDSRQSGFPVTVLCDACIAIPSILFAARFLPILHVFLQPCIAHRAQPEYAVDNDITSLSYKPFGVLIPLKLSTKRSKDGFQVVPQDASDFSDDEGSGDELDIDNDEVIVFFTFSLPFPKSHHSLPQIRCENGLNMREGHYILVQVVGQEYVGYQRRDRKALRAGTTLAPCTLSPQLPAISHHDMTGSIGTGAGANRNTATKRQVRIRDMGCRTGSLRASKRCRGWNLCGLEVAHIFPLGSIDKFQFAFDQRTYADFWAKLGIAGTPRSSNIDVPQNAIVLRSDLHEQFDQYEFGFEQGLTTAGEIGHRVRTFEKTSAAGIPRNMICHLVDPSPLQSGDYQKPEPAPISDVDETFLTQHYLTERVPWNGQAIKPTGNVLTGHAPHHYGKITPKAVYYISRNHYGKITPKAVYYIARGFCRCSAAAACSGNLSGSQRQSVQLKHVLDVETKSNHNCSGNLAADSGNQTQANILQRQSRHLQQQFGTLQPRLQRQSRSLLRHSNLFAAVINYHTAAIWRQYEHAAANVEHAAALLLVSAAVFFVHGNPHNGTHDYAAVVYVFWLQSSSCLRCIFAFSID
ncbi:hypothetical protein B0H13DRAFT_1862232 [Mycena leptocephala]|nr:hypothetical protein B0H13DRAFT_1862232 [Mycena leptocephala]